MTKNNNLRIMLSSNAPWGYSGYSNQSRMLLESLRDSGYKDLAMSCFYGLEGGIIDDYKGIKCYPKLTEPYGTDAMYENGKDFKADIVFSLQDVWTLNPHLLNEIPRWIPWTPVDYDPCPHPILDKLKFADRIISMSQFGQDQLADHGFASTMIPHGVDTKIFKPKDRKELRKKHGIPEKMFLFGMVSANKDNPPRKSFQQVIDAFTEHLKVSKGNSGLFIHSLVSQKGGFNIPNYSGYKKVQKHVFHLDPYTTMVKATNEDVAEMMAMFDVLLMPSTNEGFGIPAIEAQSCGVPVITTDFTSMSELVTPETGIKVEVERKTWAPIQSYSAIPSTDGLIEAMNLLYNRKKSGTLNKMGKEARKHILKTYDHDLLVRTKWIPLLQKIAKDIKDKEV